MAATYHAIVHCRNCFHEESRDITYGHYVCDEVCTVCGCKSLSNITPNKKEETKP